MADIGEFQPDIQHAIGEAALHGIEGPQVGQIAALPVIMRREHGIAQRQPAQVGAEIDGGGFVGLPGRNRNGGTRQIRSAAGLQIARRHDEGVIGIARVDIAARGVESQPVGRQQGHIPFRAKDLARRGIEGDVLIEEARAIAGIEQGLGAGAAANGSGQCHVGHLLLHLDVVIAGLIECQVGAQRHARHRPVRLHADFIVQHIFRQCGQGGDILRLGVDAARAIARTHGGIDHGAVPQVVIQRQGPGRLVVALVDVRRALRQGQCHAIGIGEQADIALPRIADAVIDEGRGIEDRVGQTIGGCLRGGRADRLAGDMR